MEIVINRCYGGFGLSGKAEEWLHSRGLKFEYSSDIERDDPLLVQCVKELGDAAGTAYSELQIIEIPDGVSWGIEDYDGIEWVSENHRTWR